MDWAIGSTSSTALLTYFVSRKIAISFSKWDAHTEPIFTRFRIPTFYGINKNGNLLTIVS